MMIGQIQDETRQRKDHGVFGYGWHMRVVAFMEISWKATEKKI